MTPRLAYLCLFENPSDEAARALTRQFVLVREADRMGYDEIWLAEHHDDPVWPGGGITALLGYAAGVTSHARLGPFALQPARRDPAQLAENLATIDLLSKGRLQLVASRGTPFDASPPAAATVVPAMQAVLSRVHGTGSEAPVTPRAQQDRFPVWVASTSVEGVQAAARAAWGLAFGATATPDQIAHWCAVYREASGGVAPQVLLARFAMTAATREDAMAIAEPYLEGFVARMRALGRAVAEPEALLSLSLVGSHEEVSTRMRQWATDTGVHSIAIVPTSAQFDTVKHCLADFVDEVRPLLSDD